MRHWAGAPLSVTIAISVGCSRDRIGPVPSQSAVVSPARSADLSGAAADGARSRPSAAQHPDGAQLLQPEPRPLPAPFIGCWERTFGTDPGPAGEALSLDGPIVGCDGCETLRIGPNARGLHPEVLKRLKMIVDGLSPPAEALLEPVLWVNSGARDGTPNRSMHNQGLGVDIVICGQDTRGAAAALRDSGFTCVIEYFDTEGRPCNMAHGDLRGTSWAHGAYARGGSKAKTCPKRALSKGSDCQNNNKADWSYRPE